MRPNWTHRFFLLLLVAIVGCTEPENTETQAFSNTDIQSDALDSPQDTSSQDTTPQDTDTTPQNTDTTPQDTTTTPQDTATDTDTTPLPGVDPNAGWIGSACETPADCEYEEATCTPDDTGGRCTLPCDLYCPDAENLSGTFCRELGLDQGECIPRCDWDAYAETGCREGYECRIVPRNNENSVNVTSCIPENDPEFDDLNPNEQALDDLGIIWGRWDYTLQHPDGAPNLDCPIDNPIRVAGRINGIRYRYYSNDAPTVMKVSTPLAIQLHALGDVLARHNVVEVLHIGTFNCRLISGSTSLSQHSFADAIDIYGLIDANGQRAILEEDWEHDTENPVTPEGQLLYDVAHEMFDEFIFNIILTPNYNSAHENHFHVDLSPGEHFLKSNTPPPHIIAPNNGH